VTISTGAVPAQFAYSRSLTDVDTDGNGTPDLLNATLDVLALDVTGASVDVTGLVNLTVSGELGLARVAPDGEADARYTALVLGDVTVSLDGLPSTDFGLEVGFTLTIDGLDYNVADTGFDRLDWTAAFDLDADGTPDTLDPGALLPTPVDLAIDLPSSLEFRLSGTLLGDPLLIAGPVTISTGAVPAQFAYSRSLTDVDTDGNGTANLLGATLDVLALDVTGASVDVTGLVDLTVSGELGLARVTASGEMTARYTALVLGNVTVSASTGTGSDFGFSGNLTVDDLDYNVADTGFDRLDWTTAFDLDADGTPDVLDPGALLPTPVDLAIDLPASLQFRVSGSIEGTGQVGDLDDPNVPPDPLDNELFAAGPLSIRGTAQFALSRSTVDVDTDGNGTPDLLGATLDSVALTVSGVEVDVSGLANLTVSGELGLARVTPDGGTVRYTALVMGNVTISASTATGADFGFSGDLTIARLAYNHAAPTFDRLDWTTAFDLDADGTPDVLDPGALLPTPADLSIDLPGTLEFRVSGSITGTATAPAGFNYAGSEVLLTAGPVIIFGTTEFALSRSTADVDTDGNGTADLRAGAGAGDAGWRHGALHGAGDGQRHDQRLDGDGRRLRLQRQPDHRSAGLQRRRYRLRPARLDDGVRPGCGRHAGCAGSGRAAADAGRPGDRPAGDAGVPGQRQHRGHRPGGRD
jgi:hypothetical protein